MRTIGMCNHDILSGCDPCRRWVHACHVGALPLGSRHAVCDRRVARCPGRVTSVVRDQVGGWSGREDRSTTAACIGLVDVAAPAVVSCRGARGHKVMQKRYSICTEGLSCDF